MPGIDVAKSQELKNIILGLRYAEKEIQSNVRKYTRSELRPAWTQVMREHASTRLEHRVLADNARAKVSNRNITFEAASVGRKLKGGLNPKTQYGPVEFGAQQDQKSTYESRSRKGTPYEVTRRTRAQFRPNRRKGYVFYPSAEEMIPRAASLWVQTTIRTLHEALEGKH